MDENTATGSPIALLDRLKSVAELSDPKEIRAELGSERSEDLADALVELDPESAATVLQALDVFQAAEVMVDMPTETAKQIVQLLPDDVLAAYLDVLPMDDAIDLREELGDERFEALLQIIPAEDAREIHRLLAYPDGSVGRLMTEKFFWVRPQMRMTEILEDLRQASEDKYETVNDLYVLDEAGKLVGVTSLRRVLRVPAGTLVADIMRGDVVSTVATEDEEAAARRMARYGFYALPVVDETGRMVGIFTGDDAQSILREAETEDVLAVGAVSGSAEPYMSLNPWQLYKRRMPWLAALFVAEFFTGSVLRHYGRQASGIQIGDIMMFVPLLIGAGGNSGAQVTTTITRALALDEVKPKHVMAVIGKEFIVALMLGATLGTLGFIRAKMPRPIGWETDWLLSTVVGLALPSIVVWAALVGSVLPLGAKRLKIDPAVMSAPFITTFVDATGLIIYFEIARAMMRK